MKARFIAILLSFFVISLSLQAAPAAAESSNTPLKIDLNKADLKILTGSFKGIGKKRAEAIIAYRDSHQGFKSIEELAEVKGLGQHFMESNREKWHGSNNPCFSEH
ncbi:helix-hairpin-helix domain-containing protein [Legionella sp. km772]|uniref:ComEA family DNA-binding protein n=1 Tax=Legionella sp. km772 TaxID=2498111 RepID=UPI000F8D4336|nr:helix-hairpin-helix domain-containing protein [Legionella sp. km772]RUR11928.1 helix-hairpin-helix domain-containing protein [Legionella sp. km772]